MFQTLREIPKKKKKKAWSYFNAGIIWSSSSLDAHQLNKAFKKFKKKD